MGVWLKASEIDWCWFINYIYLHKPMLHSTLTKASTLGSQSFRHVRGNISIYTVCPNCSLLVLIDFLQRAL